MNGHRKDLSCLVLLDTAADDPTVQHAERVRALGPLYGLGEAQSCALKMSRVAASATGAGRLFQSCTVLTAVALHRGELVSLALKGLSCFECFSSSYELKFIYEIK